MELCGRKCFHGVNDKIETAKTAFELLASRCIKFAELEKTPPELHLKKTGNIVWKKALLAPETLVPPMDHPCQGGKNVYVSITLKTEINHVLLFAFNIWNVS